MTVSRSRCTRAAQQWLCCALVACLTVPALGAPPSRPNLNQPSPPPSGAAAEPQGDGTVEAQESALKASGDAAFLARDYVAALRAYEQAYSLYPDARVLYNEARALQALGRNGEALRMLVQFASTADAGLRARVAGLDELRAQLRARVTEFTITVNEADAQVMFGTQVLGTTPLPGPVLLEAGQGTLRIVKGGYFSFERQVTLRGGGSETFDVTLSSMERNAKLIVASHVQGATVSIDGQPLAHAPTEAMLAPGTHQIIAHRRGFADASTQIIVQAGQRRTVTLDPIEQHPLLEQWWFWTAVGVVAAAGTTSAVLIARNHRDTSDGDFSPSAIGAPLVKF